MKQTNINSPESKCDPAFGVTDMPFTVGALLFNKMEIWKTINGYENYEISNYGRIRNGNHILFQQKINSGYLLVHLYKDSRRRALTVHRLVAINFISNPNNKKQVNHIDCDKLNNIVSNLEWCSQGENMKHAFKNGRCEITKLKASQRMKIIGQRSKGNLFSKHHPLTGKFMKIDY